jgi:hypothetical protein
MFETGRALAPDDIRHWRMIRNHEFDVAELSMSNYLMAKCTGLRFAAIPVFLHRRFRHGFIFLNAMKNIRKPTDLIGRKVGLRNFQATANHGSRVWSMNINCRIEVFNGSAG